jgi:hypothetical protein
MSKGKKLDEAKLAKLQEKALKAVGKKGKAAVELRKTFSSDYEADKVLASLKNAKKISFTRVGGVAKYVPVVQAPTA